MLGKKHQRSCTVQEEGLIKEDRHHLLLLYNQVHDKLNGITESLDPYVIKELLYYTEIG